MTSGCFSTASSAMRYTVESARATTPGSRGARSFCLTSDMRSDPLANLFLDQSGRAPGHQRDHDGECKHVLVGAGERQRDGADGLQRREQEAAEDGAVDASEPTDDRGGKADHAEQQPHAEI